MSDAVNHPKHYNMYDGIEIIDLCEQMNFNKGNAVKYITRAGLKNPATEIEDLKKAEFYVRREIERLSADTMKTSPGSDGSGDEKKFNPPISPIARLAQEIIDLTYDPAGSGKDILTIMTEIRAAANGIRNRVD